MAAITVRPAKKRVSYYDLRNLGTADLLFDEKKKKRKTWKIRDILARWEVF